MSDERRPVWPVRPVRLTLLTVTIAIYLPFIWMLARPMLLLICGGPLILGLAFQSLLHWLLRIYCPFLSEPLPLTVLMLSFLTWLGRRGGRMRVIATACAFVLGAILSAWARMVLTHIHT
jgi:hypothetical protein